MSTRVKDNVVPDLQHPLWALALKCLIDRIVSATVLMLVWPILLMIALAVWLSSPGPIFYKGIRSGLHGQPFRILKFRTMVTDAELLGGPTTGSTDPRVTPVGWFLRRAKLDELPQFFNVLKGDMSLVGPRPEVLEYTSRYQGEERLILAMKPGITDYASIEFADLGDRVGSHDPDAYFRQHILPRKNALRLKYVREWSTTTDFQILVHTFVRVLQRIYRS